MNKDPNSLAIIIATFNRKSFLRNLINQINAQINLEVISVSIILIIDGSTDGTSEMIEKDFPQIFCIHGNGNWWWTKCMNEGFKKASELNNDYVLILNDDTEIKPDYIATLWTDYQSLPQNTILGSASVTISPIDLIDFAGVKDIEFWRMRTIPYLPAFTPMFREFKGIYTTWALNGRGSLIPISIFKKIGFYDEKLLQYGSDDEFTIRARKAGFPVFISWNAKVYNHLFLTSEGTAFRQDSFGKFFKSFFNPYSVNYVKNHTYFYKLFGIKMLTPIYAIYFILGTLKAYLFKYRHI